MSSGCRRPRTSAYVGKSGHYLAESTAYRLGPVCRGDLAGHRKIPLPLTISRWGEPRA
ncbi:hypothetical protein LBGG_02037 [Lactobacillus gasseri MV-22]|nr:hypothetical protein LBGG_02037 [Lactobacillus gasseri MV-22]